MRSPGAEALHSHASGNWFDVLYERALVKPLQVRLCPLQLEAFCKEGLSPASNVLSLVPSARRLTPMPHYLMQCVTLIGLNNTLPAEGKEVHTLHSHIDASLICGVGLTILL